jgi:hypothetical protein
VACGDICAPPAVQASYAQANVAANAAAAQSQAISNCGEHFGCEMTAVRNYQDPSYAATQGAWWAAEQAYQAQVQWEQQQAEAAAQAAAAARAAQSGGFWGSVAGFLDKASSIASTLCMVACWVPGVGQDLLIVTTVLDVADGLVNAGIDFASGNTSAGIDTLFTTGVNAPWTA